METDSTLHDEPTSTRVHSYPPTPPPALVVHPPSPSAVQIKLDEIVPGLSGRATAPRPSPPPTQITEFVLAPISSITQAQAASGSFFSRALSAFKTNTSQHSNSFTLSPVDPISPPKAPAPIAQTSSVLPTHHPQPPTHEVSTTPTPLLTFHDRTPVLTVRSLTGLIEIDQAEERVLGVQTSFWVAVALTYLEFLEERESYLAAISD